MADILTQGIINGLSKALEGMDPNSPEAKNLLAILSGAQKVSNAQAQAKIDEATARKDTNLKKKIAKLKSQQAIAKAKGQSTTQIDSELSDLRGQLSTTASSTPSKFPNVNGQKDSDGDGIPDVSDKFPNYPQSSATAPTGVVASKPANVPTTSGTGTGTGTGTGGNVPSADPKQIWIDALTATFKHGIDDPVQQKQITDLFAAAKAGKWTEATFMEALKNTKWWANTMPTMRDFFIQSHDPRNAATFAQTMLNKVDTVKAGMEALGIKINDIDPVTGKVIDNTKSINELASLALQNGWDANQISQYLAKKSDVIFTGGGQIGSYVDQIKRQALNYGISLDKNQLETMQRDLLNPADGKDAQWYLNNIKQMSIDANPAFAASLKEGRTLYDVTSTYRNQMAQLLEVDPTNITWNDLMAKVQNKDKGTVNTFADFTKAVKQDPLWQTTKNAKETYSNMALDLMKQFGFVG
jgi:hypothetical protein